MPKLNIDTQHALDIASENLIGVSAAILGITGSGKSNTAAVLIEELLTSGFPMTIVDIEGEYFGLKEKFQILVAGGEHADLKVELEQAEALAELSVRRRIPVVLDMSEFSQDEMFAFLLAYFKRLWEVASAIKQPYQVVLEEAHEFVPQGPRTPLKEILTRIALRGRKRGLATILISQRSPKVDKDLLTQAQLLFLHRVIHPVDLRVYEDLIPLPARQVDDMVGSLESGQAIVLYKHIPVIHQIRLRETFHAGATPGIEAALPELRQIDASILAELQKLANPARKSREAQAQPRDDGDEVQRLQQIIEDQKAEIDRLCNQLKQRPIQAPLKVASGKEADEEHDQFNFLVKDIMTLPKHERRLLRYLVEREGKWHHISEIAKRLGQARTTIERWHQDLIQLELVQREGKGGSFRFTSLATATFSREYPHLDARQLRMELLNRLLSKEV